MIDEPEDALKHWNDLAGEAHAIEKRMGMIFLLIKCCKHDEQLFVPKR